jgi:hypothetical protein
VLQSGVTERAFLVTGRALHPDQLKPGITSFRAKQPKSCTPTLSRTQQAFIPVQEEILPVSQPSFLCILK